jgi:malonyl-CoA O-methyltransferase
MSLGPGTSALTPTIVDPPSMPARLVTVRRQFERRAARFGTHDAVVREVDRRLQERLDVIRLAPQRIVDVGCGAGGSAAGLLQRYPQARWLGVDLSATMLHQMAAPARRWLGLGALLGQQARTARLVADSSALPLADRSVDLVYSNLMLHWHPTPHTVFPEWLRVLQVDGLLLFSCFGPDTLKELRAAFAQVWPAARPLPFVDMHDFGDMMVAAGFDTPVMDVETLRLTYPSAQALLREVAALGGNPRDDRPGALPPTRVARALHAALARSAGPDGRLGLTFEIAYGHAWKPAPRAQSAGTAKVSVESLRASLRTGVTKPGKGR